MADFAELLRVAAEHHRAGRWQQAERAYRELLARFPRQGEVRRDLAWLLHERGDRWAAIDEMRRAIDCRPAQAALHNDLGTMLRSAGRVDEAVASFEQAILRQPLFWQARFNLGNAHQQLRRYQQAVECYAQVLREAPTEADVFLNLGVAYKALGRFDEARASFHRALELRPAAEPWINLGILARNQGDLSEAVHCYRRALELNPNSSLAHYNLGVAWRELDHVDAAVDSFRQAVRLHPAYVAAHRRLADACQAQGSFDEALAAFRQALKLESDDATKIRSALALPIILESNEQIARRRGELARDLDALARENLNVPDPINEIGPPAFALAYQGHNERDFQSRIADLLRRSTPALDYVAPHCTAARGPRAGRVKIGFVSAHFRSHTIGKLNAGLIERLDRDRFEVLVFGHPPGDDPLARRIASSADESVVLPPSLPAAQAAIAQREPDVLLYTDIGLDAMMYYLAHARLAPLQCVTWGHPLTTGIPTVDCFISGDDLDTPDAHEHYSEELVRLSAPAVHYFRPEPSASTKTRHDFGWSRSIHLYACLQSPFKLHPNDDPIFAEILRRDPLSRLVLLQGLSPHWSELLRQRFSRSIPDVAGRIEFVPQQPPHDFARLLGLVDVLLDPLEFSGGDTSYQSFAVGTPIVTLPGEFLRSRITYALYRAMRVMDAVAENRDDYVARAVRLGTDRDWREQVAARILAANHVLYENVAGVRALEEFLLERVERR